MSLPLQLSWRYLLSRRPQGGEGSSYLALVNLVSFLGLMLGVLALTVVVSVMNGFDRELKTRILGVVPHLIVPADLPLPALQALEMNPQVTSITPYSEAQGLILTRQGSHLMQFYGVDAQAEPAASVLSNSLINTSLDALQGQGIILGDPVARRFLLQPGDQLSLVLPRKLPGREGLEPRIVSVTLVGIFATDSELDYTLTFMDAAELAAMSGNPLARRVMLDEVFAAPIMARQIAASRGEKLSAEASPGKGVARSRSWTETHGDFFEAVRMEKIMMFVLLSFVIAVAAFGMVAGLSMMIDARRSEVAVLRTLGMSVGQVVMIFLAQGMTITLAGISAGLLLGVPLAQLAPEFMALIEQHLGASIIRGTYFDAIPVDVRVPDLVAIALVSGLIGLAASIYPSWRAALLDPSSILRYE